MACVAAITLFALSACGSSGSVPVEASSAPVAPQPQQQNLPVIPPGYDELENWSSGETLPELDAAAEVMGLSNATLPWAEYVEDGYTGVAPLEDRCIIAFSVLATSNDGRLSAIILSRYDWSLSALRADATLAQVKTFADEYRQQCRSAGASN